MRIFLQPVMLVATVLATVAGCATGAPVGGDAGQTCNPLCVPPARCVAGFCSTAIDYDHDGFDSEIDCDDRNEAIRDAAERDCATSCGQGTETCESGLWGPCETRTPCTCDAAAAPREVNCGMCGKQMQRCVGGQWRNEGECNSTGTCRPGQMERAIDACGCTGAGTRERTRSCSAQCQWGEWGAYSQCTEEGMCRAGQVDTQMQACTIGSGMGTQQRSRACIGESCEWAAWSNWSSCDVPAACTLGQVDVENRGCTVSGAAGGLQYRIRPCLNTSQWGTWSEFTTCAVPDCNPGQTRTGCDPCGQQVCQQTGLWGACEPALGSECLYIRPGRMSAGGDHYQCCTVPESTKAWSYCRQRMDAAGNRIGMCHWAPCQDCTGTACQCPAP